jgi:hypothetical protein
VNALLVDLLLALRAAAPRGLPADLLLTDMRRLRHASATLPQIEHALRDLADQRLVAPLGAVLSDRWRITALGRSALEEEGL